MLTFIQNEGISKLFGSYFKVNGTDLFIDRRTAEIMLDSVIFVFVKMLRYDAI